MTLKYTKLIRYQIKLGQSFLFNYTKKFLNSLKYIVKYFAWYVYDILSMVFVCTLIKTPSGHYYYLIVFHVFISNKRKIIFS